MEKSNELETSTYQSLTHSKWNCKYHVVFIPKCRRKALYGKVRPFLGKIFHELAFHRGCKILKGNMPLDHVHMLIEIPPKHAVCAVCL